MRYHQQESSTLIGYFDDSGVSACTIYIYSITNLSSISTVVNGVSCTNISIDNTGGKMYGYTYSGLSSGVYLYEMKATGGASTLYYYGKFTVGGALNWILNTIRSKL